MVYLFYKRMGSSFSLAVRKNNGRIGGVGVKVNRKLLVVAACSYAVLLVWIIAFKVNNPTVVSDCYYILKPLTVWQRLKGALPAETLKGIAATVISTDFLLNVLIFVPLGVILPLGFKKLKLLPVFGISAGLSILFESVQLFTCIGVCKVHDVVSNTAGALLGYALYLIIKKCGVKEVVLNRIIAAITLLAIPFCVFAIIKTALSFEIYLPSYHGL